MQKETIDRYSSHLAQNPDDRVKQLEDHGVVREAFAALDRIMLDVLPAGRERSLVITNLEQAAMWANKAVASPYPVHPEISVRGTQGQEVGFAQSPLFNSNFRGAQEEQAETGTISDGSDKY